MARYFSKINKKYDGISNYSFLLFPLFIDTMNEKFGDEGFNAEVKTKQYVSIFLMTIFLENKSQHRLVDW